MTNNLEHTQEEELMRFTERLRKEADKRYKKGTTDSERDKMVRFCVEASYQLESTHVEYSKFNDLTDEELLSCTAWLDLQLKLKDSLKGK